MGIYTTFYKEIAELGKLRAHFVYQSGFRDGRDVELQPHLNFSFNWSKTTKEAADKLRDGIIKTFNSKISLFLNENETKTYSLIFGAICEKCKKTLGEVTQYRCLVCNPAIHFCPQCVESVKNPKTPADLVHPHALYYIQKEAKA